MGWERRAWIRRCVCVCTCVKVVQLAIWAFLRHPGPPRFVFEKESLMSLDLTKSAGPAVQAVLEVTCLHFPALPSHPASSHVYLNSMQVLILPNAQRRLSAMFHIAVSRAVAVSAAQPWYSHKRGGQEQSTVPYWEDWAKGGPSSDFLLWSHGTWNRRGNLHVVIQSLWKRSLQLLSTETTCFPALTISSHTKGNPTTLLRMMSTGPARGCGW